MQNKDIYTKESLANTRNRVIKVYDIDNKN